MSGTDNQDTQPGHDAPLPGQGAAPPSDEPGAPAVAPGDTIPSEAVLRRAEAKPPLYRFFRGGMYVGYMLVTVWFVLAIIVAAWAAVWGESGKALRARELGGQPLTATPHSDLGPPPAPSR